MSDRRVAVVTGAGTGMGAACAQALAASGLAVVLAGRREEKLNETAAAIRAAHDDAVLEVRPTDVGDPAECEGLVADAVARLGRVDVAVTAAATFEPKHILEMSAEDWDSCLDIDLRGSMLVAAAAARAMRDGGEGGRIVLFSSINGRVSEPETAHYSAAKAAVMSLARSMAVDLAGTGIAVNAIAPGWVDTPMIAEFVAEATEEDLGRVNPLRRLGRSEELANFVVYLANEAPEFLTGSSLFMDGGQTAIAPVP
ncbi:MAG: SDR family oxidoreductase [Actinobacteria bacterium]|nr:SDR family oxidoreductase [Actinomycetota bacterium]